MTDPGETVYDAADARLRNILCEVAKKAREVPSYKSHKTLSLTLIDRELKHAISRVSSAARQRDSIVPYEQRELTRIAALCVRMLADMEEGT